MVEPSIKPSTKTPAKPTNPFSAVELVTGRSSCRKAKLLSGTRQLLPEAPVLPIDGCDTHCRCSYKRHSDRRHINRRRTDDGLPEGFIWAGEMKRRRDRRAV